MSTYDIDDGWMAVFEGQFCQECGAADMCGYCQCGKRVCASCFAQHEIHDCLHDEPSEKGGTAG